MKDPILLNFYKSHIEDRLMPFWTRALDQHHGGVYTCFNNTGDRLLSQDKYTWSQGRFLWVWSRLAKLVSENKLSGDSAVYKAHLKKTADFLEKHVFLENGNCAYRLSRTGAKLESRPGQGFDTSIYADCFITMGLAEYAALTNDAHRFEKALEIYRNIRERSGEGELKTEPFPIPEGYKAHAVYMIMLNVAQGLAEVARKFNHREQTALSRDSTEYMQKIMHTFCLENHRIVEMLPEDPSEKQTLLYRHINPGHTLESMWFVMHTAGRAGRHDLVERAAKVIEKAVELGWDQEYGGIFRFVDERGGCPEGDRIGTPAEKMISGTWDTKLWWVHSEALYATLLAFSLTGRADLKRKYDQVHAYVFGTFPNPDKATGEWIQIRDRMGRPIDQVVALPVKDPFHILRNMLLMVDLLGKDCND